ncbi:putative FAD-dependent oxygenase [Astrocystis sublimbata]|nr:putative FAD-dependent oxygenase [Astrocystis sublimbata]
MRPPQVTLWSVCALCANACSGTTPAACQTPEKLSRKLGSSLSPGATVYLPGSDEFKNTTTRWSELDNPTPSILVVPATEDDVAQAVLQANECELPILAYNGVHGAITTLGQMDNGIAISLNKLSNVTLAKDGETVTILGGTMSKTVTDTLLEAGKQTVTGTCECVSYLGPALGGGHGWLQGHHGLVADQFVSMNIVLADGTQQTIDSSSDLWWAMQGAGQNFGIVTSVTAKAFGVEHSDWAIDTLTFSGDKVEEVYEAANKHLSDLPEEVINWSYWLNIPDVDSEKPVIVFYIIQEGVKVVDEAFTKPFHALGPLSSVPQSGTYQDLAAWTGIDLSAPPCQKAGFSNPRFPIYIEEYNATAQKEIYSEFATIVGGASSPFANSLFMFEGYSQQGVKAVASASTAFAFRADNLLAAPLLIYQPVDKALDAKVEEMGNRLREMIRVGSGREEMHVYVNYAYGNEGPEGWFGAETWRQERLRALKRKYDPEGKFSFYAPVA